MRLSLRDDLPFVVVTVVHHRKGPSTVDDGVGPGFDGVHDGDESRAIDWTSGPDRFVSLGARELRQGLSRVFVDPGKGQARPLGDVE